MISQNSNKKKKKICCP